MRAVRSDAALFSCAVVAAGVGYAGDEPLAVLADEVEEVGAAMLDLAVDEEVERRPDDGEIVVDFDERVVDALFDLLGAGLADAGGEVFEGHLRGLAVAHEDHDSAGEGRLFDGGGVTRGHAGEHGLDGGEDRLVRGIGRSCVEGERAEGGQDGQGGDESAHGPPSYGIYSLVARVCDGWRNTCDAGGWVCSVVAH